MGRKLSRSCVILVRLEKTIKDLRAIPCQIVKFEGEQPREFKSGDNVSIDEILYQICSEGGRRREFIVYLPFEKAWVDVLALIESKQDGPKMK